MVGAETQDVARRIRAIMRCPQGLDMGAFRVGAGRRLEAQPADLATDVVQALDLRGDLRTAEESLHERGLPRDRDCVRVGVVTGRRQVSASSHQLLFQRVRAAGGDTEVPCGPAAGCALY